jgi:hypothetical protein
VCANPQPCVCANRSCADKIEWRKKYGKYKLLSAPAKWCACVLGSRSSLSPFGSSNGSSTCHSDKCLQKTVKQAYQRYCTECARAANCCSMCIAQNEDVVLYVTFWAGWVVAVDPLANCYISQPCKQRGARAAGIGGRARPADYA